MKIIDTQILSYVFKGRRFNAAENAQITSITASEFLLVQGENPSKANYYPVLPALHGHMLLAPSSMRPVLLDSKKHAERGKHRTDQIILNFGLDFPPYVEFGSLAISEMINSKRKIFMILASRI